MLVMVVVCVGIGGGGGCIDGNAILVRGLTSGNVFVAKLFRCKSLENKIFLRINIPFEAC